MKRRWKQIGSLFLAVCMVIAMVPMTVFAQEQDPGAPASPLVGSTSDGVNMSELFTRNNGIYYGTYRHATELYSYSSGSVKKWEPSDTPILWQVIGTENNEEAITLLSKYTLVSTLFQNGSVEAKANVYDVSLIKDLLGNAKPFSTAETSYVIPANVETKMHAYDTGDELTGPQQGTDYPIVTPGQTLYIPWGKQKGSTIYWTADAKNENLLSKQEAAATLKSGQKTDWWLRSPYSNDSKRALIVTDVGGVDSPTVSFEYRGVRPAFKFNPTSILFASEIKQEADGWKGETESDSTNYSANNSGGKNFKLTLLNSMISLTSLSLEGEADLVGDGTETLTTVPGGILALTGTANYPTKLVYKIVDRSSDRIVGYGSGETSFDETSLSVNNTGLQTGGDYTLYVWAQKDNTINSHEGSAPMYFKLEVKPEGKASDGINMSELFKSGNHIYYGSYAHATALNGLNGASGIVTARESSASPILWRAMGEENNEGTITLLSEYALDTQKFHSSAVTGEGNNYYNNSDIRLWLNGIFLENSFQDGEKTNMAVTTVATGMYDYTNGTEKTGSYEYSSENGYTTHQLPWHTPTQKLYLPWGKGHDDTVYWTADNKADSASALTSKVATLKGGTSVACWLRSPDSATSYFALGCIPGGDVERYSVTTMFGIRPSFKLIPSFILFASEIKSGADVAKGETVADPAYYSAGANGTKNFKLTLVNNKILLSSLSIGSDSLSGEGETLTLVPGSALALTGTGVNHDKLVYKIVDRSNSSIVGYGSGDKTSLSVNSPGLTPGGDYTLHVWAQKDNAINSHEGSMPMYFKLAVDEPVHAEAPQITSQPASADYYPGDVATALSVTATVGDGGTLSYQWFEVNGTEKEAISGATSSNFTPPISAVGTKDYCITVTNTNNMATGEKTATTTSNKVTVTVSKKSLESLDRIMYVKAGLAVPQSYDFDLATLLPPDADPAKVSSYSIPFFGEGGDDQLILESCDITGSTLEVIVEANASVGANVDVFIDFDSDYYKISRAFVSFQATDKIPVKVSGISVELPVSQGAPVSVKGEAVFKDAVTEALVEGLTPTYTWSVAVSQGDPTLTDPPSEPGDYILTVSADGGIAYDIIPQIIYFQITKPYIPGSNADLSLLTLGGSTVSGFQASEISYNVELPYNTLAGDAAATLGATAADPKASVIITQASSLPGQATVTVTAENGVNTKTYTVNFTLKAAPPSGSKPPATITGIPVADLSSGNKADVTVKSSAGTLILPSNMLSNLDTAKGARAEVKMVTVNPNNLTAETQALVGGRPIVAINLLIDGRVTGWNNPDAPVTVSIPYVPTAEELQNPDGITAYYIDSQGNLMEMAGAKYDPATKSVVFQTTHFSYYAVGYKEETVKMQFGDVLPDAWYYDAVRFCLEKGITSGTSETAFSPNGTLTRGQFITMLLKAYDIDPLTDSTDNFVDAGSTYYTGYLAAAKAKGIASGLGNNKFAPEQAITRQEMFTLLYNALKSLNKLPATDNGKVLADFTDSDHVANWAVEAMSGLTKSGMVSGSGGKLDPRGGSTRAQMAQVLYNLLEK